MIYSLTPRINKPASSKLSSDFIFLPTRLSACQSPQDLIFLSRYAPCIFLSREGYRVRGLASSLLEISIHIVLSQIFQTCLTHKLHLPNHSPRQLLFLTRPSPPVPAHQNRWREPLLFLPLCATATVLSLIASFSSRSLLLLLLFTLRLTPFTTLASRPQAASHPHTLLFRRMDCLSSPRPSQSFGRSSTSPS